MASTEQLIISTFNQSFRKYVYEELVIGKLAHTDFKTGINTGDEVDVLMPGTVKLLDYDGGDLAPPETVDTTVAKVRIDRGKAVHFRLEKEKARQIKNAPSVHQKVDLVKDYSMDGVKQFSAAVDKAYGELYTRAGHVLQNGTSAIELNSKLAKEIFAYMQAEFKRGDRSGHTNWIDGQMMAIIPPEYALHLGLLEDLMYVESGHKKMQKGVVGNRSGWDIVISNNVANPETNIYYPLFGVRGKTLAGGVSKDLDMMSYIPDPNFDTCYKGYSVFGVGAPRADLLGTVKVKAELVLPSLNP